MKISEQKFVAVFGLYESNNGNEKDLLGIFTSNRLAEDFIKSAKITTWNGDHYAFYDCYDTEVCTLNPEL